ncbi:MAG: peptidoglycan editing factor PgeF [Acidobacteria bacterium]|nr:peptidoglycan editing factor PgeF [Acidobacteriota bacterium]
MSNPVEMIIDGRGVAEAPASAAVDLADAQRRILTDSDFYWREQDGLKLLVCRPLEDAGFVNGFSTRLGGVSDMRGDGSGSDLNLAGYDEDQTENIEENRRRFLALFDSERQLATAWQVHGDGVKIVDSPEAAAATEERFDSLVSDMPGLLLGVKTADCVPVLIGDPRTGSFAAIHAGWRGTVRSIVAKAVMKMVENYGAVPADMIAAIGPAACGRNYEIGEEVIAEFTANFAEADKYFSETRPGHALIDLHAANRDQLIAAGLAPGHIFVSSLCTMETTDLFFSYRVEKSKYGRTGRLMSVIGRE